LLVQFGRKLIDLSPFLTILVTFAHCGNFGHFGYLWPFWLSLAILAIVGPVGHYTLWPIFVILGHQIVITI